MAPSEDFSRHATPQLPSTHAAASADPTPQDDGDGQAAEPGESPWPEPTPLSPDEQRLAAGADRRIWGFLLALTVLGVLMALRGWGPRTALGLLSGAAVAALNFLAVELLANALVRHALAAGGVSVRLGAVTFLVLTGGAGALIYAILASHLLPGIAVLWGLSLLVLALLVEGLYQVVHSAANGKR